MLRSVLAGFRIDQPAIASVPDNFINPLPSACDHRFLGGHRFQINTTQPFIPAGQSEKYTAAHRLSDLLSTLTAEKANLVGNVAVAGQSGQAVTFGTIANNLTGDMRIMGKNCR